MSVHVKTNWNSIQLFHIKSHDNKLKSIQTRISWESGSNSIRLTHIHSAGWLNSDRGWFAALTLPSTRKWMHWFPSIIYEMFFYFLFQMNVWDNWESSDQYRVTVNLQTELLKCNHIGRERERESSDWLGAVQATSWSSIIWVSLVAQLIWYNPPKCDLSCIHSPPFILGCQPSL